jgi:hypothetical protein
MDFERWVLFAVRGQSLVEREVARCGLNGAIVGLESPERLDRG